jgi:hypothetical protein
MYVFSVFLYMVYLWNAAMYQEMKQTGDYPCYGWVGGGSPDSAPPVCFYDPSAY